MKEIVENYFGDQGYMRYPQLNCTYFPHMMTPTAATLEKCLVAPVSNHGRNRPRCSLLTDLQWSSCLHLDGTLRECIVVERVLAVDSGRESFT